MRGWGIKVHNEEWGKLGPIVFSLVKELSGADLK